MTRIGREQRMLETANAALGGSATADNLADQAGLATFDPGILTSMAQGRFGHAAMTAVARALNEAKGTPPAVSKMVARALMETDPARARAVLTAGQTKSASSDAATARAIAIMNALSASGAGRLAAP